MSTKKQRAEKFKHLTPLEAIHEAASDLHKAGMIDVKTMRELMPAAYRL